MKLLGDDSDLAPARAGICFGQDPKLLPVENRRRWDLSSATAATTSVITGLGAWA
jgi:hypothetical protein